MLAGFLKRRRGKGTQEVAIHRVDEDAVVAPEQVFAASREAFAASSRSRASSGGGAPASSLAARGRSFSSSSVDHNGARLSRQSSGGSAGGGDDAACAACGSGGGAAAASPMERLASIERAKSIGASIARAVEIETLTTKASHTQPLRDFRSYGEKEVAEAAAELDRALAAWSKPGGASPKRPKKGSPMLNPKQMAERAASLRQDEGVRHAQFMACVNRMAARGADDADQMAAVREYAQIVTRVLDELMLVLPTLPPSVAPSVSSYLSHLSQHRALATKALQSDVGAPKRAEAELDAQRRARLSQARASAEAREAGIDRSGPLGPSARARAGL